MKAKKADELLLLGGAVIAAIVSSLCCILPVIAVVFGLGAFGIASTFESMRPYLLALTLAALAFAFYKAYFRRSDCTVITHKHTKIINKLAAN